MTPEQYCHSLCKKSGSSFVYTFLFMRKQKRLAMEAFYAFCREVDDAVDEAPSGEKGAANLRRWKEEVFLLYGGKPQHPVAKALLPVIQGYHIPKELLDEIIFGCEMDLNQKTYATFKELEQYCYRVASCVGLVSLHICEVPLTAKTEEGGIALGKALQWTNILRDIAHDLKCGRVYLPQEDLNRFGVTIEGLSGRKKDNLNLLELLYFEIKRARHHFTTAWETLPASRKERRQMIAARMMGKLYEGLLDKISRDPMRIFREKMNLTGMEKLEVAVKEIGGSWI